MAVYKRSYRGYDGALHAGVVALYSSPAPCVPRPVSLQDHDGVFRVVLCCAAGFLFLIYFAHNWARIAALLGERSGASPIAVNERILPFFLSVQGVLAFILTAFVGPRADLARSRQPRFAALPVPAVFPCRVRARQDGGLAHPAFADHLGSGTCPVRRAGEHRRARGWLGAESVDRLGSVRRRLDLDPDYLAAGAGALGMDQVEDCRRARCCWRCFSLPLDSAKRSTPCSR